MIIYSVNVTVDRDVENDWVFWMQSIHIPDVMAAGYFTSFSFRKVLEPHDGEEATTYTIDYTCDDVSTYTDYREKAAPALQKDHSDRYEGKFAASRRLLEVIAPS